MCHIEHMVKITIRELHMKTGDWVRKATHAGNIVVTDRNRPIARLIPFTTEDEGMSFADRPLVRGFAALRKLRHDSARYVSEDRERA